MTVFSGLRVYALSNKSISIASLVTILALAYPAITLVRSSAIDMLRSNGFTIIGRFRPRLHVQKWKDLQSFATLFSSSRFQHLSRKLLFVHVRIDIQADFLWFTRSDVVNFI